MATDSSATTPGPAGDSAGEGARLEADTRGIPAPASDAARVGRGVWLPAHRGRSICIDWERWLDGTRPIDPYLVWAEQSDFKGLVKPESEERNPSDRDNNRLAFAVELAPECSLAQPGDASGICDDVFAEMQVPGLYRKPKDRGDSRLVTRFITARVAPDSIPRLLASSSIRRMQLGLPRIGPVDIRAAPAGVSAMDRGRVVVGIIDDGCPFAHPALCDKHGSTRVHFLWDQDSRRPSQPALWSAPPRAEYGFELRHHELATASRLAFRANRQELAYTHVNYGPVRLDPELNGTVFDPGLGQQDIPVGTMRRKAHGAGVLFMAAGALPELDGTLPLHAQRVLSAPSAAAAVIANDQADKWPIVFVQLPTRTALDTSGGSLAVHVLDGIRYIIDRAECIGPPVDATTGGHEPTDNPTLTRDFTGNSVVINVSYGATAGPHDGTSILEQAVAEIVADDRRLDVKYWSDGSRRNTWVCLAAGNAHGSRTHARLRLPPGATKSFIWSVGPDNPHQSFLEVWLPDRDEDDCAVLAQRRDRITLVVRGPGGLEPMKLVCGQAKVWHPRGPDRAAVPMAGAVFARSVAQGLRGTMVLIALAPTRRGTAFGDVAPHGRWYIDVSDGSSNEAGSGAAIVVHAWVERNDLVYGNSRGQQGTVFGDDPVPEATEFTPNATAYRQTLGRAWPNQHLIDELQPQYTQGSISGVATPLTDAFFVLDGDAGRADFGRVVAVGSHRLSDGEVSPYSSGGPNRHAVRRASGQMPPATQAIPQEAQAMTFSVHRNRPDVTAPADVGTATTGLRVAGMRGGEWVRMSGTSIATPSVVRAIANAQFDTIWQPNLLDKTGVRYGLRRTPTTADPDPARPTPTPLKDDLFRRGTWRLD